MIFKPSPADSQALYLGSLKAIGLEPDAHDIGLLRMIKGRQRSGHGGLAGKWCEVWVSQFTYFQQVGGIECQPVPLS